MNTTLTSRNAIQIPDLHHTRLFHFTQKNPPHHKHPRYPLILRIFATLLLKNSETLSYPSPEKEGIKFSLRFPANFPTMAGIRKRDSRKFICRPSPFQTVNAVSVWRQTAADNRWSFMIDMKLPIWIQTAYNAVGCRWNHAGGCVLYCWFEETGMDIARWMHYTGGEMRGV